MTVRVGLNLPASELYSKCNTQCYFKRNHVCRSKTYLTVLVLWMENKSIVKN
jgi:hypothetical protein